MKFVVRKYNSDFNQVKFYRYFCVKYLNINFNIPTINKFIYLKTGPACLKYLLLEQFKSFSTKTIKAITLTEGAKLPTKYKISLFKIAFGRSEDSTSYICIFFTVNNVSIPFNFLGYFSITKLLFFINKMFNFF